MPCYVANRGGRSWLGGSSQNITVHQKSPQTKGELNGRYTGCGKPATVAACVAAAASVTATSVAATSVTAAVATTIAATTIAAAAVSATIATAIAAADPIPAGVRVPLLTAGLGV